MWEKQELYWQLRYDRGIDYGIWGLIPWWEFSPANREKALEDAILQIIKFH